MPTASQPSISFEGLVENLRTRVWHPRRGASQRAGAGISAGTSLFHLAIEGRDSVRLADVVGCGKSIRPVGQQDCRQPRSGRPDRSHGPPHPTAAERSGRSSDWFPDRLLTFSPLLQALPGGVDRRRMEVDLASLGADLDVLGRHQRHLTVLERIDRGGYRCRVAEQKWLASELSQWPVGLGRRGNHASRAIPAARGDLPPSVACGIENDSLQTKRHQEWR
jgi:hypothetical protein